MPQPECGELSIVAEIGPSCGEWSASARSKTTVTGGSDFHGLTKPDIDVGIGKGSLHVPDHLLPKLKEAVARL